MADFPPVCRELREARERQAELLSRSARPLDNPRASMHQAFDSVDWYVTLLPEGSRSSHVTACAFLLGPYASMAEAEANKARGHKLAQNYDHRHFYDYIGVSSIPSHITPRVHFQEGDHVR